MLLAKIKEELDTLYDDLREAAEAAAVVEPEAEPEAEAAPEQEPQAAAENGEAEGEAQESAEENTPEEEPVPIGPQETDYQVKGYHLDVELPRMHEAGTLHVSTACYRKLLAVSPAADISAAAKILPSDILALADQLDHRAKLPQCRNRCLEAVLR